MPSTIRFFPRLFIVVALATSPAVFGQNPFTRGDVDCDGVVDLLDPYKMRKILFEGETQPCDCPEAMDAEVNGAVDANGSDGLNISDGGWLLRYLFVGGPPPVSGLDCMYIPQCPQNIACPSCEP